MAAIVIGTSQERAKKRFPHTAPQHIRGTGEFCLVERDAAWEKYQWSSCGAPSCVHDHVKVTL